MGSCATASRGGRVEPRSSRVTSIARGLGLRFIRLPCDYPADAVDTVAKSWIATRSLSSRSYRAWIVTGRSHRSLMSRGFRNRGMPGDPASRESVDTGLGWRIRRRLTRRHVDAALDRFRFRIDTSPRNVDRFQWLQLPELQRASYHDLPWVGLVSGSRGAATMARFEAMRPLLEGMEVGSAVDIGSNAGWFTFTLTEVGIPTIGVERDPRALRTSTYVRRKSGLTDSSFLVMELTARNVEQLPDADCYLVLSVWHHWVREFGLAEANTLLEGLWSKCRKVLIFETGEAEMPASWGLPAMLPDPDKWLAAYLAERCRGGMPRLLGRFDALGPNNEPCQRSLLAIVRV